MLGFGEQEWLESPLSWRLGDVAWGVLDFFAIAGIVMRSPIGVYVVVLAAFSQIVVYGIFPGAFALTDEHWATLKGMVCFHVVVLVVLGCLVYFGGGKSSSQQ